MTTEVVVMNKEAVALAADSAVTISYVEEGERKTKIYNSANKLYKLSSFHPVGIMIYNDALYMGIPWETIIKLYRDDLSNKKYDTLEQYAQNFFVFLRDRSKALIPEKQERRITLDTILSYFVGEIGNQIGRIVEEQTASLNEQQINAIASSIIKEHYEKWKGFEKHPVVPDDFPSKIRDKYLKSVRKLREDIFNEFSLSSETLEQLDDIAINLFYKKGLTNPSFSGVVFSGFGENEIFPSCISYEVETFLCEQLKYSLSEQRKVDFDSGAVIIPFAQREEVITFVEGIHPGTKQLLYSLLSKLLVDEYPDMIANAIGPTKQQKEKLQETLREAGQKRFDETWKHIQEYTSKNYVRAILGAVAILPKDELAATAEALVNITAVKRRISMESETVGGPIDVAVISKKDGFIWIKRKHYFKPEYNYDFFSNSHIRRLANNESDE